MALYGVAVFLSAFLLFQVQPILAKFLLPRYGGGAAVWTSCLLFFQVALLGGYAWAHFARRWLPEWHRRVHIALVALTLLSIPILPPPPDLSAISGDPVASIVLLLALTVGLPYLALASTGPLLQSWFADRYPGRSPYRLYALSNIGSLLGLLTYPVLVEPSLTRDAQVVGWSILYLALVGLLAAVAFGLRPVGGVAAAKEIVASQPPEPLGTKKVLTWLLLAASASALLMAVTNHLSQAVAVVPFLWVLPLALYLLSFIVTFDSDRWYDRRVFGALLAITVPAAVWALNQGLSIDLRLGILIWGSLLFVVCTCCHGELVRQRPDPQRLTLFYLAVAAGGALGGLFVGVVAPLVFSGYWELHIALGLACALIVDEWLGGAKRLAPMPRRVLVGAAICAQLLLGTALFTNVREFQRDALVSSRNFYGVLRVDYREDPEIGDTLRLFHGQTRHGFQYVNLAKRRQITSYYAPESGIGMAIEFHPRRDGGSLRVGVVGLGVGTLAAYGRDGESIRFWEIDPDVERIARSEFTYLDDSLATVDVVLGDARLRMAQELRDHGPGRYDVLAIDAFSSDAIPIHLLTAEAADLYWELLDRDGLLVFHISNRFLELEPVVRALALHTGAQVMRFHTEKSRSRGFDRSTWLVLARRDSEFLRHPEVKSVGSLLDMSGRAVPWTDDFASLWPVLDLN